MNTTHLWNSQTYQLEKEAVLLARDTADVWSFQTFAKPATQLRAGPSCEEMCRDYPGDDSCLEICESGFDDVEPDQGPPEDAAVPEDFAAMEMTCNDMCGDDDPECLKACNACKLKISDMFSEEMYDCMDAAMNTEAEHDHSGEHQHGTVEAEMGTEHHGAGPDHFDAAVGEGVAMMEEAAYEQGQQMDFDFGDMDGMATGSEFKMDYGSQSR